MASPAPRSRGRVSLGTLCILLAVIVLGLGVMQPAMAGG